MANKKPIYVEPKNYFGPTQKPKTNKKTVKKPKK